MKDLQFLQKLLKKVKTQNSGFISSKAVDFMTQIVKNSCTYELSRDEIVVLLSLCQRMCNFNPMKFFLKFILPNFNKNRYFFVQSKIQKMSFEEPPQTPILQILKKKSDKISVRKI
jgi:hypothetical protein